MSRNQMPARLDQRPRAVLRRNGASACPYPSRSSHRPKPSNAFARRRELRQTGNRVRFPPVHPLRAPPEEAHRGTLLHERRNGHFLLQVTGHPSFGLPWGQDRLVPIFLATLAVRRQSRTIRFANAAEMLDTFGMPHGGAQYRRLIAAFQRIFGATIFFGTD